IDANDHVWGANLTGGDHQDGTLWRWTPEGGVVKLGDLDSPETSAQAGSPVIFAADGTAFCMSGNLIWKWTAATGLVVHADLPLETVGYTIGAIALDGTGAFVGTSDVGAAGGRVWKWTAAGGAVALQAFPGINHFFTNDQGVTRDAQGRIYGATATRV